jgi:beta-lactamase superfamily II metal-dependent hydrolase
MSYIEILPAYHGDAFIIHAFRADKSGIVVVDGGPAQSRIKVLRKLEELDGIDLMVLTHFDSDHISGLNTYLEHHGDPEKFKVKEMWVNCAREIDIRQGTNVSYGQANKMADLLGKLNDKKEGGILWEERIAAGYKRDLGFATITVVGPDPGILDVRQEKYEEAITKNVSFDRARTDISVPLETLAQKKKVIPSLYKNNELANMASIAFIIESDGLKALMLGDSYPDAIEKELRQKYSEKDPLKVDVVKVAHHGSRNNISNTLLDIIDCQDYIISTNGGIGNARHPDREALANILCHPRRNRDITLNLYFNYDIDEIQKRTGILLTDAEKVIYNCEIFPSVYKYPL